MRRNTKVKQSIYLDNQLNQELQQLARQQQIPKARVIAFLLEVALSKQLSWLSSQLRSNQLYVDQQ